MRKAGTHGLREHHEPVVYRFPGPMNAFTKRDEERLIEAGHEYYSTAFPNPERVGCPDATTMQALVRRQVDRAVREQIDSHMMQCSPCFNDYVRLREARERSARRRKLATLAAMVVLVVMTWALARFLKERSKEREPSTADNGNLRYEASLLDLRNKAALRGAGENGNGAPAVLPGAPLDLSIYLPTGSEPGKYEVQVTQGPGEPLLKAQGQARLREHIAVLEVRLDLQQVRSGQYMFWIREGNSSWSYYPILVEAGP